MKITLELPDWCEERHIRIKAGIELVALKLAHEDFFRVKKDRCVQCGKCCSHLNDRHFFKVIDGKCEHLKPGIEKGKATHCDIAIMRPNPCDNDPLKLIEKGDCHITYDIIPRKNWNS
ncbi:MAG: hypothetical protein GWN00_39805 [Aliifodinibius sp.]|nr:hypothetical protein [Phycisphaerae bacterium]NIT62126.1 hypothetical protein [Fodinibius sp.]NIV10978.1 hypothetical protein [Fodinibius sp.]NIY30706.1 hypothetical protein [Fodinibius sp.]